MGHSRVSCPPGTAVMLRVSLVSMVPRGAVGWVAAEHPHACPHPSSFIHKKPPPQSLGLPCSAPDPPQMLIVPPDGSKFDPKALRTLTLTPRTLPTGATLPRALTWKLLLSSPAGLVARQVYKPESATYTKPGEGKK